MLAMALKVSERAADAQVISENARDQQLGMFAVSLVRFSAGFRWPADRSVVLSQQPGQTCMLTPCCPIRSIRVCFTLT
jgi:hypothetical protein